MVVLPPPLFAAGTRQGEPTDAVQIKSLTVKPDPPKPGHNLTIYASGTVKETIDVTESCPTPPIGRFHDRLDRCKEG
jgi:ML domain